MKLESQITNTQYRRSRHIGNHSSLIDNQSKRRSTPVENVRQITPFYAKQTQFRKWKNEHNFRYDNQLQDFARWLRPKNKAKTKPKQTQLKPISKPIKANIEAQRKSRLFGNHSSLITNHLEGKPNCKQHTGRKKIFKTDNIKKNNYHIARHNLFAVT